jgi:hypothetical protein
MSERVWNNNVDDLKEYIEKLENEVSVLERTVHQLMTEKYEDGYIIFPFQDGKPQSMPMFTTKKEAEDFIASNPLLLWPGNYLLFTTKEWKAFKKDMKEGWDKWGV